MSYVGGPGTTIIAATGVDAVPASTGGTFSGDIAVSQTVNGNSTVEAINTSSGTMGIARFKATGDSGDVTYGITSSGYTNITAGADAALINANNTSGGILFALDGVETMRINASGDATFNTATSLGADGITISTGFVYARRTSDIGLFVRRDTTQGILAQFEQDGTSVGQLNSKDGDLAIGTGTTGLRFTDSGTAITPINTTTNVGTDATIDLGSTGARFKEGYFSGGVYLNGTGAANRLDYYEEGTWTPTFGGIVANPTVTYSIQTAQYTRIGRIVYIECRVAISAVSVQGSGAMVIDGLPYPATNVGNLFGGITIHWANNWSTDNTPRSGYITANDSRITLNKQNTDDPRDSFATAVAANSFAASQNIIFSGFYFV